ncbi:MAG: YbhN family protein [Candidatus Poribacteria bacterium]|nr:YbhN family protein [Candidatus Poribacteria bacterium]
MKILRQYLGGLIALMVLYFLVKEYIGVRTEISTPLTQLKFFLLIPSFVLILIYWLGLTVPWFLLLRVFTQTPISFHPVFLLFHLSNVTRYLPGRVWGVVRMLALSKQFGLSRTIVGVSLPLHAGFQTLLAGVIVVPMLFSPSFYQSIHFFLSWHPFNQAILPIVCGIVCIIIFFFFPQLRASVKSVFTQVRQTVQQGGYALRRCCLSLSVWHLLLWVCQGFAFFLFINGLFPIEFSQLYPISGAYTLAWLIGFLSIVPPGGLGVREAVLTLLLSNYMPTTQATLCVLLYRVWTISAEVIWACTAFFLNRRTISRNVSHSLTPH